MNTLTSDKNNEELLLSEQGGYVMMEWEKPYMEACIDKLCPKGDVLEIGWGCGYSATRIVDHVPKSYTVIECCPDAIKRAGEWAKKYPDVPITIVEGKWQEKLHDLGLFNEIFMDDYPLDITKESSPLEHHLANKRLNLFIDLCVQNHMHVGSKISAYLNGEYKELTLSTDSAPFVETELSYIDIKVSKECNYRNLEDKMCTIPIITKTKEFDFLEAQRYIKELINNPCSPTKV